MFGAVQSCAQLPCILTIDDLNLHRHEHDLGRGLFLGEGIRGYRRGIRGGAADREPTAEDAIAEN